MDNEYRRVLEFGEQLTLYGLRKRPTPERVQKMARAWQGWRSYATFYLWLTYWETAEWRRKVRAETGGQPGAGKDRRRPDPVVHRHYL